MKNERGKANDIKEKVNIQQRFSPKFQQVQQFDLRRLLCEKPQVLGWLNALKNISCFQCWKSKGLFLVMCERKVESEGEREGEGEGVTAFSNQKGTECRIKGGMMTENEGLKLKGLQLLEIQIKTKNETYVATRLKDEWRWMVKDWKKNVPHSPPPVFSLTWSTKCATESVAMTQRSSPEWSVRPESTTCIVSDLSMAKV